MANKIKQFFARIWEAYVEACAAQWDVHNIEDPEVTSALLYFPYDGC